MSDYRKIDTTPEVWAAIRASHPELKVFSTYSAPEGDYFGNSDICKMMTEYGFDGCDQPIIGAETTWDRNPDPKSYKRINEKNTYWLCVGIDDE